MSSPIIVTPQTSIEELLEKSLSGMDSLEITISDTGFGPWSHSKLKQLYSCPLQFLCKNLLKITYEVSTEQKDAQETLYWKYKGLVAHRILEDMVMGMPFEESYQRHEEEFLPHLGEEKWADVSFLKDRLESFCYRLERFHHEHTIVRKSCEQQLAVDVDWNPVPFNSKAAYFRGILDLTAELRNRDVALFDHKNGGSAKYGIKNYEFQLRTQSLLFLADNPDIRGVIPFIHFIEDGDVAGGRDNYYSRQQVMEEFSVTLKSCVHGTIESLEDAGAFRHITGNHCKYCEMKPICRGGKRGTANFLQPIVDKSKVFFRS